jgi:23S rRNA pseudouridine2605 synthase
MRINKFIAQSSGLSRRSVDQAINTGRIWVNNHPAIIGQEVVDTDTVALDGEVLSPFVKHVTIMLNKPVGFVVSRNGQGSKTVYDLLTPEFYDLKPIGRLDKDSSGLLLLTNDGQLANELMHPKFLKQKIYKVTLDKTLQAEAQAKIEQGVQLEDGLSKISLTGTGKNWIVKIAEGRNRQIRRTFAKLNYGVIQLHRISFGNYQLGDLALGKFKIIN